MGVFSEQYLSAIQQPEALAYRVRVEEQIDHRVNLAYRYLDEAGTEHIGFRAVWDFVYGPWQMGEQGQNIESMPQINRWKAEEFAFNFPAASNPISSSALSLVRTTLIAEPLYDERSCRRLYAAIAEG